jgi:hypothetical protein
VIVLRGRAAHPHLALAVVFGLRAAAGSGFAVDLAGAVTYAPCGTSTSMGALAPNIFHCRVMDMHSFPRGLNLLRILGHRGHAGINSPFCILGLRLRAVINSSSLVISWLY